MRRPLILLALFLGGIFLLALYGCGLPGPGPAPKPIPPPVTPVSQCTEVFPTNPGGYTRPAPTNHPLVLLPALRDYAGPKVIWLDRHCGLYYLGPLDYRYPNTDWCAFRPDLGDRIYSGQDTFIIPIPASCVGQSV